MEDARSLDWLVSELNSSVSRPGSRTTPLADWLERAASRGGQRSLPRGRPAAVDSRRRRDQGAAVASLDSDDIEQQVLAMLPPKAAERYRASGSADASFRQGSLGRFRVNLHRERGRAAASIGRAAASARARGARRCQPRRSAHAIQVGARPRGRSHRIWQDDHRRGTRRCDQPTRRQAHHHDRGSDRIRPRPPTQHRRAGGDRCRRADFPTALRSAVRQSPDVIVVGEMRDPETMRIALAAGETGHWCCRRSTRATSRRRFANLDAFPVGASADDPPGAVDGARGGDDPVAAAENRRRPGAGGRTVDGRIRRAAAHPQERAAAPASGDDDHAEGRVVHDRGVPRPTRASRRADGGRCPRARDAPGRTGWIAVATVRLQAGTTDTP